MNIQKIYQALTEDNDNSATGIIVAELENQGYNILINDKPITAESIFNEDNEDIEGLKEIYD